MGYRLSGGGVRTRWAVRIVLRECELRLEVASVVKGIWVEDDQCDAPLEDVVVDELRSLARLKVTRLRDTATHVDVGPRLLA